MCTNAGVKTPYIEFWMGHTGRYLEDAYFRGQIQDHVEEYRRAIPFLTIMGPPPQDYEALAQRVQFLERNGKEKQKRIEELKAIIEELIEERRELQKRIERLDSQQEVKELREMVCELAGQLKELQRATAAIAKAQKMGWLGVSEEGEE